MYIYYIYIDIYIYIAKDNIKIYQPPLCDQ